jgi:hypothetical protein
MAEKQRLSLTFSLDIGKSEFSNTRLLWKVMPLPFLQT